MIKKICQMVCTFFSYIILAGSALVALIIEGICLFLSIVTLGSGFIHFEVGKFLLGIALCCFHWIIPLLLLCILITIAALLAMLGGENFD